MTQVRFFDDDGMDFATRCVLSGVRHAMAEVGETLAAVDAIEDGRPESWLETFIALGRRVRRIADDAAEAGHRYSAWNAALRSANYLYAGQWWAPVTTFADQQQQLWAEHRDAWDLAVAHWPTPASPIRVPHDGLTFPGYWFTSPAGGDAPAPTVVIVQGLGTPISDLPMTGLDGAVHRGYHVLVFDGPGQGAALHRQGLTLDQGWPGIIGSALDWLDTRGEVDPQRVALSGLAHGSLFAALAAPDPRVAALVVDPAVTDLGADARAALAAAGSEDDLLLSAGTTTVPTGTDSPADAAAALATHRVDAEELAAIRCPVAVVASEEAEGFAGQDLEFTRALSSTTAQRIELRSADGAGMDAGLDASQVHDAAVFDWLDTTLGRA